MARTGGRFPFDASLAVTGPARVLWAPTTVAVPADLNDVIQLVADGSAPLKVATIKLGQHELFESVSSITRSFSAQVAELDDAALKIIENTALTAAVAASAAAAPAGSKKPAQTKVFTGLYSGFVQYRVAWLFARPVGASQVTEPGPPVATRPPFVARIFPLVQLAKDSTDVESSKGDPTNVEVQFDVMPDASQGAGKEHGYWVYETPGAIVT
jgi:hypothetical protein